MAQQKGTDAKWHLQTIFLYYASFGDRNNFKLLKMQNYRRFLIDSETVTSQDQFPYYDILFKKVDRNAVVYLQFLEMIPSLAQLVYTNQKLSRKAAFTKYLQSKIQPLYANILKKSDYGQDITTLTVMTIEPKVVFMLQEIPAIRKSYEQYILATSMHQKLPMDTFEKLHVYLKDFQLSPQVVYRSVAYAIFLYLLKIKPDNTKFTYQDFIDFLVRVAEVGSKRSLSEDLSQVAKVVKILERMEISAGFAKLSKKMPRDSSQIPTFLMNHIRQMEHQQIDDGTQSLQESIAKMWPSSTRHKNCTSDLQTNHNSLSYASRRKDSKRNNYETVQTILEDETMNFGRDLKDIKRVFEELCSYGEVGNTKTLKSIKIKKLYEQTGLLKMVSQPWLDIKMTNLSKSSGTGKIQFAQFLDLIALTSKQLNASYDEVIRLILETHDGKDDHKDISRVSKIEPHHDLSEMLEILKCAQKQLERVFMHYASKSYLMNFEQLTKLTYEFQIFPQMIAKNRLYQLFQSNCKQNKLENQIALLAEQPLINIEGFFDVLAGIAAQINEESLGDHQKAIILLEKMHESKGQKNVVIPKGSLVSELRIKYGSVYEHSFRKKQKPPIADFDELIGSLL